MKRCSLFCLMLAGCALGPDFELPGISEKAGYTVQSLAEKTAASPVFAGEEQRFVESLEIPARWWELFKASKLNLLVERSIKGNPSIDAAQAAMRQAHELYTAQWASFLPVLQGEVNQNRAKDASGSVANPSVSISPTYSLYTAQFSVSYAPDVFGGTRRAVELAKAQWEAMRFQLEAAYLTLSGNVVVTALQEASLKAQVKTTERLVAIQHELTETLRRQRRLGTASELDLLLQEAAEAQTAASLPALLRQVAQAHDAMAALLGRFPNDGTIEPIDFSELTLPRELPVSLPSKLIEQRPDIRQAEENLHAATAQVGVAVSSLFPQFSINGGLGSSALRIGDIFGPYNGFWNFGTSLTQTLFDGGALLHKRRAADAAMDQAAALYRGTVIGAVQNVADALRALQYDADAVKANNNAARAARRAFDIAVQQRQLGTVSVSALLTAEIAHQQAELALIQAQANRLTDTAGLFQALGGGWWNRQEAI